MFVGNFIWASMFVGNFTWYSRLLQLTSLKSLVVVLYHRTVQDWIFQGQLDNSQYIGIVSDPQALRERSKCLVMLLSGKYLVFLCR